MAISTLNLKALHLLIERIRRLVDPSAIVEVATLDEAHRDYEEAIREANDRLRECDDLLRDGHRSQALQRCEQDPDLLQVVAVLDFAERPLWHGLLIDSGYPPPATLLLDVAVELNQAYNLEKPLTELMRMHRLHALAGSPLKSRLGFLRKIAQRDADNPIWRDDVRLYERSRHLQIEQELVEAERLRDANLAAQLAKEVADRDWLESPPQPLVETSVRIHSQLRQARACEKLRELARELHEASGAREESRAGNLRQSWNAQVAIAQLPSSDPMFEEVEPVFVWLDREEARRQKERNHKNAILALEQALDAGAGRIDLERCYNEVTRHGALPDELDRKVQLRVELIERRTRMKWRAGVVLGLAVIALAAVGVVWYVQSQQQSDEFARDVAGLSQLVAAKNRPQAKKYLSELEQRSPATFASPDVRKLAADLDKLEKEEQTRQVAWQRTLSAIQAGLDDGSIERLEAVRGAEVTTAMKLAVDAVERREVKDLDDQVRAAIAKLEDKLDAEFSVELEKLGKDVTAVSPGDRETIGKLRVTAEKLQRRNRASLELRKQVEPLLAKLDQKSLEDDSQRKERTARAAVIQAIGNPAIYADALAAYAKAVPQSPRGRHFTKVAADDAPLLPAVELWNRLVEKWSQRDFGKVTPDEAKLLLAELEAIVQSHPGFPAQNGLKSLEPYLQAVQARVDDGGTRIYRPLLTALDDVLFKKPSMLLLDSRKRHYFEREPMPDPLKPENLIFWLFNEISLVEDVRTSIPIAQVSNPRVARPTLLNTFDWTSPQQRFRKKAIDLLDHCTDDNWEPTFSALLVAVDQEPLMEPTLQLYLKQTILDLGVRGSHCFKLGFEPTLAIMGENAADIGANWIDPADEIGNRARKAAEEMFERLPDQAAALKVAKSHLDSLRKRNRGAQYAWVGCLIRDDGNQWRLELPRLAAGAAGPLVVLRRDAAGNVLAETIAQAGTQPPVLDAKAASVFLEGRPVYLASGQ